MLINYQHFTSPLIKPCVADFSWKICWFISWNVVILCCGSLKPSTQKVLSLAAEFKTLEKDKEHLRVNLDRAEEEVRLLFEQNKTLDVENKRLLRQLQKERNCNGSGGKKSSSASAKVRGENGQRETWLQKTSHALPVCVYTYTFTASVIPEEQIKLFARLDRLYDFNFNSHAFLADKQAKIQSQVEQSDWEEDWFWSGFSSKTASIALKTQLAGL